MRKTILIFIACMFRACLSVMAQTLPDTTIAPAKPPAHVTIPAPSWGYSLSLGGIMNPYMYISGLGKYFDIATTKWVKNYVGSTAGTPRPYFYPTDYGAVTNGVTPVDGAYSSAKTAAGSKRVIYFQQNSTGNAKYYFSGNPSFGNVILMCDPGVILSIPGDVAFGEDAVLASNFIIEARNVNVKTPKYSQQNKNLFVNSSDIDRSRLEAVNTSQLVTGTVNWTADGVYPFSGTIPDGNNVNLANSSSGVTFAGVHLYNGDEIYTNMNAASASATGLPGLFALTSNGSYLFLFDSGSGSYSYGFKKFGQAFQQGSIAFEGVSTANYQSYLIKKSVLKIKRVNKTTAAFYVNGHEFSRFDLQDSLTVMGVGNYNQGESSVVAQNFTKRIDAPFTGKRLKVAVYGNSLTSPQLNNWVKYFKDACAGSGVFIDTVYNYAVAGQSFVEQYNAFQANGINADAFIISLGTNEIQAGFSEGDVKAYYSYFYGGIHNAGKPLILEMAPMFLSKPLNGNTGQATLNYEKGGYIRGATVWFAANNPGVELVDNTGIYPSALFGYNGLRDAIHPSDSTNQVMGYNMARKFLKAVLEDGAQDIVSSPSFVRSSVNKLQQAMGLSYDTNNNYFSKGNQANSWNTLVNTPSGSTSVLSRDRWAGDLSGAWELRKEQSFEGGSIVYRYKHRVAGTDYTMFTFQNGRIGFKVDNPDYEYDFGNGNMRVLNGFGSNWSLTGQFKTTSIGGLAGNIASNSGFQTQVDATSYSGGYRPSYSFFVPGNFNTALFMDGDFSLKLRNSLNVEAIVYNSLNQGYVVGTAAISAITSANYNAGNNYTATINPSVAQTVYQGMKYKEGNYFYIATADNVITRIALAPTPAPFIDPAGNEILTNRIISKCGGSVGGNVFEKSPNGSWYWIHTDDDGSRLTDPVTVSAGSQGETTVTLTAAPNTILSCTLP